MRQYPVVSLIWCYYLKKGKILQN